MFKLPFSAGNLYCVIIFELKNPSAIIWRPHQKLILFLIYVNDINDLSEEITFAVFVDNKSLFSAVNDPNISANELNKDLKLISE